MAAFFHLMLIMSARLPVNLSISESFGQPASMSTAAAKQALQGREQSRRDSVGGAK